MIRVHLGKSGFRGKKSLLQKVLPTGKKKTTIKRKRLGKLTSEVKVIVVVFIAGAIAVLPYLFFNQYQAYMISQHEQKVQDVKEQLNLVDREIKKLLPFKKELTSYKNQKEIVKKKLKVVKQLLSSRGTPVFVMDALSQSLPRKIWMKSVELDIKGGGSSVSIMGKAFSNEDISDYLDRLAESIYLENVRLKNVKDTRSKGEVKIKEFGITARAKISYATMENRTTASEKSNNSKKTKKKSGRRK